MPPLALKPQLVVRELALFNIPGARGTSSNPLQQRVDKFIAEERKARIAAADLATKTSQGSFKYRRPFAGAQRQGRSSTGGRLASFVKWQATRTGFVALNMRELDQKAPHWIIQELGTDAAADLKIADENGPQVVSLRTVKSQIGRAISGGLVFAWPNGRYSPPTQLSGGEMSRQQLYLRSKVAGSPVFPAGSRPLRITKEIVGQHFAQKGGQTGFRQYDNQVLTAARNAFKKGAQP